MFVQTQYTANGQTTKPTRRSATAMDSKIKLERDDRRVFRGSFQTDKMTSEFPKTTMGNINIAATETAADKALAVSAWNHTLLKASLLVMFKKLKWPATAAIVEAREYKSRPLYFVCVIYVSNARY
ncbi:hypothetical protein ACROYT_G007075 [Oculina patagonica]